MELTQSSTSFAAVRNEQALVAAARRGDDRAFEQLYAQYRDRAAAFIFSKVRDHGRAEDISQEVFMAALRQLRATDQTIAFKPWIFAIAKNACIDEFRRSSRAREVPVENDDEFPADRGGTLSLVPTPPAAVEGKQRLLDLRGAFGGLSDSHHQLLVMRELEGRSYDEIGERLGMTKQMVESGLFRARRKLSEEYEELASGRRCEQVQTIIDTGDARTLHALGIKQRRRLSRHLSHCEACRHQARLAGVDETLVKPRRIGAKIAALLPFGGLWRWPWRGGRRGGSAAANAKAHAATGHVAASAAGAAQAAGTAGSSITLGQAAAAVAALAVAGAGGGVALAHHGHGPHPAPPLTQHIRGTSHPSAAPGAPSAGAMSRAGSRPGAAGRARAGAIAGGRSQTTVVRGKHVNATGARRAIHTRQESPRHPGSGGSATTSSTNTGTAPTSGVTNPISGVPSPVSGVPTASPVSSPPVVSRTVGSTTGTLKTVVAPVAAPVTKVVTTVTSILPTPSAPTTPAPPADFGSGSTPPNSSSGMATSSLQDPVGTVNKIVNGL